MENNKNRITDTYIDKDRSLILKEKRIVWCDIDENGYINNRLKKGPTVYIFKIAADKIRYYVGSSVNMPSRMSKHRSGVVNYKDNCRSASPIFFDSILKYG